LHMAIRLPPSMRSPIVHPARKQQINYTTHLECLKQKLVSCDLRCEVRASGIKSQ